MQNSRLTSHKGVRTAYAILIFAMAAGIQPAVAEDNPATLEKAATAIDKLTDSAGHGMRLEQVRGAAPGANSEIVDGGTDTPAVAQPFVSKLTSLFHVEFATK